MPNKVKFEWKYVKQKAFKDVNQMLPLNNLLDYPDLIKWFEIHTNDRNLQFGVVIRQ